MHICALYICMHIYTNYLYQKPGKINRVFEKEKESALEEVEGEKRKSDVILLYTNLNNKKLL